MKDIAIAGMGEVRWINVEPDNMKEYLFLGGPLDGHKRKVSEGHTTVRIIGDGQGKEYPLHDYYRVAMRGLLKPDLAVVYTYERPWRDYEIINHLLAHYHNEPA